jgi:hypothetical protein
MHAIFKAFASAKTSSAPASAGCHAAQALAALHAGTCQDFLKSLTLQSKWLRNAKRAHIQP